MTNSSELKPGLFGRLKNALARTRTELVDNITDMFAGAKKIDENTLEHIETSLLSADVGVDATDRIIEDLTKRLKHKGLKDESSVLAALRSNMLEILAPVSVPLELPPSGQGPFVVLMVGVNGSGKTTTIGKLAQRWSGEGRRVMLAAGDTFRAAAVEQLQTWGKRTRVPVIAQHAGADSASVLFDALQAAKARNCDVLLGDTAGRLHTHGGLMDELRKVVRVIGKLDETAPHETLLVLDAGTGQNALAQAQEFAGAVGVSGLVLTKLDGTARGGVVFGIAHTLGVPIRYIGVGERADDLRPFDAQEFVDALLASGRS
ncbi:MAG: signal recognition particle-docking protein FtsY [Gammaproteobacteria bacterium]|nr:signal recognition particle-docking protein FtsY [Gammaproteobacteria bacterium]